MMTKINKFLVKFTNGLEQEVEVALETVEELANQTFGHTLAEIREWGADITHLGEVKHPLDPEADGDLNKSEEQAIIDSQTEQLGQLQQVVSPDPKTPEEAAAIQDAVDNKPRTPTPEEQAEIDRLQAVAQQEHQAELAAGTGSAVDVTQPTNGPDPRSDDEK